MQSHDRYSGIQSNPFVVSRTRKTRRKRRTTTTRTTTKRRRAQTKRWREKTTPNCLRWTPSSTGTGSSPPCRRRPCPSPRRPLSRRSSFPSSPCRSKTRRTTRAAPAPSCRGCWSGSTCWASSSSSSSLASSWPASVRACWPSRLRTVSWWPRRRRRSQTRSTTSWQVCTRPRVPSAVCACVHPHWARWTLEVTDVFWFLRCSGQQPGAHAEHYHLAHAPVTATHAVAR